MKKLTNEQINQIFKAREALVEKINYFSSGVSFPSQYNKKEECNRVYWMDELRERIREWPELSDDKKDIDFSEMSDFDLGVFISNYFFGIKKVFYKEFSGIIYKFDEAIEEYKEVVMDILKQ